MTANRGHSRFTIYTVALIKRHPDAITELLAYQLTIIKAATVQCMRPRVRCRRVMSFMYIKKSSGPRTEPCGTPEVTALDTDVSLHSALVDISNNTGCRCVSF